jgi:uncharacterized membrane protein
MTHFSITVEIQAPPARVWAVMKDVERWHEWTPSITSITRLDHGPLAVGSRALVRQPKLPPAKWEVTELVDGSGFTWVSRGPGLKVTGRHTVQATQGGSRVTLAIEYSGFFGALLARLTQGLNERYIALEANGLKSQSEASATPPPAQS